MTRLFLAALLMVGGGVSASTYVYPAQGQSPEQQALDTQECNSWAVAQSGYNPANPPPAPPPPSTGGPPQTAGAGGGAFAGAAIGGIVDGSSGAWKGAAIGGLIGGVRRQREMEAKQAQQYQYQSQQSQYYAEMQQSFNRAYATCLQGRGYTVG